MGASIHSDLYIKNSFINIFHLYVPCRTVQLNFFLNSYVRFNFDWSLQYNIFIHSVLASWVGIKGELHQGR